MTALNTGMRKGELFGLQRKNVLLDQDQAKIWVRHSYDGPPKSGKPRPIPISGDLLPVLRDYLACCPAGAEDLVFPVWVGDPRRSCWRPGTTSDMGGLPEILAEAGVSAPRHPWHAFRHTFASQFMQRRGKSYIYALKELLGHADLATTELYLHWAPDWLSDDLVGLNLGPKK
jgi:integrase